MLFYLIISIFRNIIFGNKLQNLFENFGIKGFSENFNKKQNKSPIFTAKNITCKNNKIIYEI